MIHIRPTTALADRALLPEDPGAALALAQALLDRPLMFNHHRGLWGYTGEAGDGLVLTVQSTGIGGPSAAVVLDELIALGLRRAVRIGTCAALDPDLRLGDLIVAEAAFAADGTSRALGAGERAAGDAGLTAAIRAASTGDLPAGTVASTDLFYEPAGPGPGPGPVRRARGSWRAAGAVAVDLESAALFRLGDLRRVAVAAILVVADIAGPGPPIEDEALAAAVERAGRCALAGLGPGAPA